jgi:hypothetical protein
MSSPEWVTHEAFGSCSALKSHFDGHWSVSAIPAFASDDRRSQVRADDDRWRRFQAGLSNLPIDECQALPDSSASFDRLLEPLSRNPGVWFFRFKQNLVVTPIDPVRWNLSMGDWGEVQLSRVCAIDVRGADA